MKVSLGVVTTNFGFHLFYSNFFKNSTEYCKQQWGTSVQQVLSHYSPHADVIILGVPQERPTLEYIRRGEIYESFYVRNYYFYQYYFEQYNNKRHPIGLKVLRPELEAFTNYIESIKYTDKKEVFILGGHHLQLGKDILHLLQKTASDSYEKSYYSTKLYWFELGQR